jgi:putative endonuclease
VTRREEAARLGREGEQLVRQALERRGVEILAANWHCPYGELDLIAATPTHIRFIEVKTRTSAAYMEAREAVDGAKRRKILLTAQCWLMKHPQEGRQPVFDVAEVYIRGEEHSIRYYANAFDAEEDTL